MLIIFFILFNHSAHQDIDCKSCHHMTIKNRELNSEKKENCKKCHKKKVIKLKLKLDSKIKFNHEKHNFLKCESCHLDKDKKIIYSKMDSCISCHKEKKVKNENSCEQCHRYKKSIFNIESKYIFKPKSHYRTNYNKFHIVDNEKKCLSCHKKSYCIDCHQTDKKKVKSFHNNDYLTTHKFETNFSSCDSCHKRGRDCEACHQKTGISSLKKRKIKNYSIHPKGWVHGDEARRDITKCVSCHKERDCLKCHKESNNPHKNISNICEKTNLKSSCLKCHKNSYIKDKCNTF